MLRKPKETKLQYHLDLKEHYNALSGLSDIVVLSPLAFATIGFAKISVPEFNLTLHLSPDTSVTSPAKVLFSPINSATNEL